MALVGLFGRPYIGLDHHVDLGALAAIHDEVCLALTQVPVDCTGGGHRSMGIVPPSREGECLTDYGEAIRAMSDADFATFRSLSDDAARIDVTRRHEIEFGEEREHPLSRRQMLWLKVRFGVYFPWKAYVELIPNRSWSDKSESAGKSFTRQARAFFPKTVAFALSLPFERIGRCNIMGLEANDYGTAHRDGDPADQTEPDHFMTFVPGPPKRLFLWDEEAREKTHVAERAYWFNDFDYHGVDAAPFFRYSIRIDGIFRSDFVDSLRREAAAL